MSERRRSRGSQRPRELFLSHSSKDRPFVRKLHSVLEKHGLKDWYSAHRIVGAQQWHDEIGRALERCDWLAVILSPSAVRSKWVKRELLYTLQEDTYEGHIVPVMCKACDPVKLSWTLKSFQWVDFTKGFDRGCTDLLRIWGIKYSRV